MFYSFNRSLLKLLVPLFAVMAFSNNAYAEVSDKVPSLSYIWGAAILLGAICFIATFIKRWLAIPISILPALWFISLFMEIYSPDVGPSIIAELGYEYVIHAYATIGAVLIFIGMGWLLNKKRSRLKRSN